MDWHEARDAFTEYLASIRGYSEHTVKSYEQAVEAMLEASEIEQETEGYRFDITPYRMRIAHLSKKSIALKLSAVRAFVRYIERMKGVRISLHGDSTVKVPQTLPKPIEASHIDEVLRVADPKARLAILMLYGLGLRISELAGLQRSDICEEWVVVTGKGNKTRHVPLPQTVQTALETYLKSESPRRYLFEKGGAPMNSAQLRYLVQKPFRQCGIKATPHQLRHSFATHLLHNGARIADVSELLGHSSMATTQIYTKLSSSKKMQEYVKAHPLTKDKS